MKNNHTKGCVISVPAQARVTSRNALSLQIRA